MNRRLFFNKCAAFVAGCALALKIELKSIDMLKLTEDKVIEHRHYLESRLFSFGPCISDFLH